MYTNLALSLLPCRVGAAVPGDGWSCRGMVTRPPEARALLATPFLRVGGGAPGGGRRTGKGTTQAKGVPQPRPPPGSPHPLSMGPGLPRLCPTRAKWWPRLGGWERALARDWKGSFPNPRPPTLRGRPSPLQKGWGSFPTPTPRLGAWSRPPPLPGPFGPPPPPPGRPAAGHAGCGGGSTHVECVPRRLGTARGEACPQAKGVSNPRRSLGAPRSLAAPRAPPLQAWPRVWAGTLCVVLFREQGAPERVFFPTRDRKFQP